MIPETYDEIMRPALAQFYRWTWDVRTICDEANELRYQRRSGGKDSLLDRIPDPLRYPERDAWTLLCALLSKRTTLHLNASEVCEWFSVYSLSPPLIEREGRGNTLELAMVLAAYEVVKGMEEQE